MTIEWWRYCIAVFWLGGIGVVDIRRKEVPLWPLLPVSMMGMLWRLLGCEGDVTIQPGIWHQILPLIFDIVKDLLPGAAALAISRYRPQSLGEGDGWVLLGIGLLIGWRDTVFIVFLATLGGAIIGGIGLVCRKMRPDTTLPFVPFLCAATLLLWMGRWSGAS